MRTTIDLPDDLLRRAKSAAALRGIKLKDFVASALERSLNGIGGAPTKRYGRREPPPVMLPKTGQLIPSRSNAEVFEMLDQDDDGRRR